MEDIESRQLLNKTTTDEPVQNKPFKISKAIALLVLATLLLAAFVSSGVTQTKYSVVSNLSAQDKLNAESSIFASVDANTDGIVSKDEFASFMDSNKGSAIPEVSFDEIDTDADGIVNLADFQTFLKSSANNDVLMAVYNSQPGGAAPQPQKDITTVLLKEMKK